ncbi:MAG: 1-acylglycerol-3-phosphate O-acyltransferase [Succinivibrionaceae bacterium]
MICIFRLLILGFMAIIWLFCGLFICAIRPKHPNNVYFLTQLLKRSQWVLGIKVRYKFDVKELEKEMPALFVANHQSNWDIVTIANIPRPGVVCVGKKSLIYTPVFGILFYLSGNILIDRSKKSKAGSEFMTIVKKIVKEKLSIWMFPEGHRSKGEGLLPFKGGAVHTAKLAKVPIYPFVISSYCNQIKLNRWNNGEIIIDLLPTVKVDSVDKKDLNKITQQLHDDMLERLKQIDQEAVRPEGDDVPLYR